MAHLGSIRRNASGELFSGNLRGLGDLGLNKMKLSVQSIMFAFCLHFAVIPAPAPPPTTKKRRNPYSQIRSRLSACTLNDIYIYILCS